MRPNRLRSVVAAAVIGAAGLAVLSGPAQADYPIVRDIFTADPAALVWLVDSALYGPLSAVGTIDQLVVSGAEIGGGAILVGNGTGEHPVVVSGSAVDGPLVCLGNRPAPSDDGVPNTVAGPTVGQC